MKNRTLITILISMVSIAVLWILCPAVAKKITAKDGHLPSQGPNKPLPTVSSSPASTPLSVPRRQQINYYRHTENKPDLVLSMHVLEVDPFSPDISVKPVTSHDTLYGYAYLSEMNEKWRALAAVNGGFSSPDGLLGGLYAVDGKLLTTATGQYPALIKQRDAIYIADVKTRVWVEGDGIKLEAANCNRIPAGDGIYIYTPYYGTRNRIEKKHLNAVISNGEVRGLISRKSSYEIPEDGFLISAVGKEAEARLESAVKPGMVLKASYEILVEGKELSDFDWAYECGSWILRNSKAVVPPSDTWVGTFQTRVPRTAVGIKEDGTLIFVVADGRQKGLSDGLTGDELAQRLIMLGVKDAVNLDGGASSEMIVDGRIVNSPSAGRERMVASCFVLLGE